MHVDVHLFCVCACMSVSDQEGGRWRSVSRRGPKGGAAVRGAGQVCSRGKLGKVSGCLFKFWGTLKHN